MSSHKIDLDKNTGESVMIVTFGRDQAAIMIHSGDIVWATGPMQIISRPQKGARSEDLVRTIKSTMNQEDWVVEKTHVYETDGGPIVVVVCDFVGEDCRVDSKKVRSRRA